MKAEIFGLNFKISFPAVAFLTLAILCDNQGTVLICLFSSLFHELGHILVMKLKGAKIKSVSLNLGDVAINADLSQLSYKDELLINAGGIAVNFILSFFSFVVYCPLEFELFYSVFVANILIGCFNFLPIRYLDGGQILLLILQRYISQKVSERILNILTICFMVPAGAIGILFLFNSSYNFSLLFAVLYLICTLVSKEFKDVS